MAVMGCRKILAGEKVKESKYRGGKKQLGNKLFLTITLKP